MDMANILRNFDAAGKGEKSSASSADKNSMRSILESFYSANTSEQKQVVNEAVSITSDTPDELAQLLKVMGGGAPTQEPTHNDQEMDMAMMRQMMADPEPEEKTDRCVVIWFQIKLSQAPLNRLLRPPAPSSLVRLPFQVLEPPPELIALLRPVLLRFKCFPPPSRLSTSDRSDALSNIPDPSI